MSGLPCTGGRTSQHVLWFEGLSHSGGRLCRVRDQGDAGGHAVGSGQFLAGRWRPAGGAAGVHLVIRSETLHYMYLWSSDQTPHYMYLLVVRSETLHYMYLWSSDQRHYTTCISGQMEDGRLGCPFGPIASDVFMLLMVAVIVLLLSTCLKS